jgi:hypothetical protein
MEAGAVPLKPPIAVPGGSSSSRSVSPSTKSSKKTRKLASRSSGSEDKDEMQLISAHLKVVEKLKDVRTTFDSGVSDWNATIEEHEKLCESYFDTLFKLLVTQSRPKLLKSHTSADLYAEVVTKSIPLQNWPHFITSWVRASILSISLFYTNNSSLHITDHSNGSSQASSPFHSFPRKEK